MAIRMAAAADVFLMTSFVLSFPTACLGEILDWILSVLENSPYFLCPHIGLDLPVRQSGRQCVRPQRFLAAGKLKNRLC